MASWVMVFWAALASWAMPKSVTFTLPSRSTMMLWGLMSRWMMPLEWAWLNARMIWVMKCWASRQFSGVPLRCIYCFSVSPSTSSMTM